MKYLGIDYGRSKMGLSISEGQIASPLKVIEINSLKDAISKTSHIIQEEKVDRIIIGVAESGEAKSITKKFILNLKETLKDKQVEIIEVEETLSSHEARDLMIDVGVSQNDRQKKEDAYAAVLILQNFLDSLQ